MTAGEYLALCAVSMPLVFARSGFSVTAPTPAGYVGWSEHAGLYEWRREGNEISGPGTFMVCIEYSGGDRQRSSRGRLHADGHQAGSPFPPPCLLGLHAAVSPARMN